MRRPRAQDQTPACPTGAPEATHLLRLYLAPGVAFGPGKAALLEGIRRTGSIAAAGRSMGMSYKRAWYLVEALNSEFREPLVQTATGGARGGGARLTETGIAVLDGYRQVDRTVERLLSRELVRLRAFVIAKRE